MGEELLLMDGKIPVENVEHFAFHPTNVPMLENPGTPRPDDVLHHLIVEVLKQMDGINAMSSSLTSSREKKKDQKLTLPASTRAPTKILSQAQRSVVIRKWGFARLI